MSETNEIPDFKGMLSIDRSRIPEMLETQATRYMLAAEYSVEADKEVRDATLKLDVVYAAVYKELKSIVDGKGKPLTEAAVSVLIKDDARYQTAYNAVTAAKANAKLMAGNCDSFQQRKTMLKSLADLTIMGLSADPSGHGRNDRFREESTETMRESFNRRHDS